MPDTITTFDVEAVIDALADGGVTASTLPATMLAIVVPPTGVLALGVALATALGEAQAWELVSAARTDRSGGDLVYYFPGWTVTSPTS
jgi:hypothetical protein